MLKLLVLLGFSLGAIGVIGFGLPALGFKKTPARFLSARVSTLLLGLNLGWFWFSTDQAGQILPVWLQAWGYSWLSFTHHPLQAILLSPFLHFNLVHLLLNGTLFFFLVYRLESEAGWKVLLAAYLPAMLLSNPLTSWLANAVGLTIGPEVIDVGASLGIFACGGALWYTLRWRWVLLALLMAYGVAQGFVAGWIGLDHCVAIGIGWLSAGFARGSFRPVAGPNAKNKA